MQKAFLYGANVHANGIRQHYIRYGGKGPVIVLVPGITSPAVMWGFVADELAADYDVYVLDVRGRGLSAGGADLDYSLNACAADINAFIGELGLRDVIGLGHSMGARHLVRAAHQGKIQRLLLVDPPVSGPGRRPYPATLASYVEAIALARHGATIDDLRRFTPTWSDEEIRLRTEWLHTCHEAAVIASFYGFQEDDIHQDIAALRVPTSLVTAERGGVVSSEDIDEIKSLCPGIHVTTIANAGHMIPWDNLPGFLIQVRGFLKEGVGFNAA